MARYQVAVVGAGYVGLTTGACLAHLGHEVVCADINKNKIERLRLGDVDIHEHGLNGLVDAELASRRLSFTTSAREAVRAAEVVMLCVPTPMGVHGGADVAAVESVVEDIRDVLPPGCVLVTKSTVPVGTAARVHALLGRDDVRVVSNPEFLREGNALHDFLEPQRIVIGSDDEDAIDVVAKLYDDLSVPVVRTDVASAELAKYASNGFLVMKLSYVNMLAELCEKLGADIDDVTRSMGYDDRIGPSYLSPGPGWGGSCLPKDTQALLSLAAQLHVDFAMLRNAVEVNTRQVRRTVAKVRHAVTGSSTGSLQGIRLALLGLTFKAGTDDLRASPALAVANLLADEGAKLYGYDPYVPAGAEVGPVELVADPYQAANDAAAVVLLTEWPQFRTLDWTRLAAGMANRVVVDTRNHVRDMLTGTDLAWRGVGRNGRPSCG